MIVREVTAGSVLTKSGIPGADYCINPYVGCVHACRYCYASFMKRFTGHTEPWGSFVDVKVNAPEVLRKDLRRTHGGSIIVSSVTDPYQPVEVKYRLTRRCLEELLPYRFSLSILTKSPLVLRDIDLFRRFSDIEIGITVTSDDERMRRIFEPEAPPVNARIETLRKLCNQGLRTYAFIGPLLPMNPEALTEKIGGYINHAYIGRMNYIAKTVGIYRRLGLERWLDKNFTEEIVGKLREGLDRKQTIVA